MTWHYLQPRLSFKSWLLSSRQNLSLVPFSPHVLIRPIIAHLPTQTRSRSTPFVESRVGAQGIREGWLEHVFPRWYQVISTRYQRVYIDLSFSFFRFGSAQRELSHTILLHPSYFGAQLEEYLRLKLYEDVEGTCNGTHGYVLFLAVPGSSILSPLFECVLSNRFRETTPSEHDLTTRLLRIQSPGWP